MISETLESTLLMFLGAGIVLTFLLIMLITDELKERWKR